MSAPPEIGGTDAAPVGLFEEIAAMSSPPTLVFASSAGTEQIGVAELVERAERVARVLVARGLEPRSRVILQSGHSVESSVLFLACLRAGLSVIPVPASYRSSELASIHATFSPMLVASASPTGSETPDSTIATIAELVDLDRPVPPAAAADLSQRVLGIDEECVIVVTSGSTGLPKGVVHSQRTLRAEVRSGAEFFGEPEGAILEPFPAGHIAGTVALFRACLGPTTSVFMERWDANLAAAMVAEFGIVAGRGAPLFLEGLLDRLAETSGKSTLKSFLCGGAPVPSELIRRADEFGIAAYNSWGMSEHPSLASGHPAEPLAQRVTLAVIPHPGSRVRIARPGGGSAPTGAEGEVLATGPEQFLRYIGSDAGPARDAEGWFHTGDLGILDEQGRLRITGRLKDIIIRGGESISAAEVESVLATHEAVRDVAVVAIPHERYGEQVCAVVVLSGDRTITLDEIRLYFRSLEVDPHKAPEILHIVEKLPRGPLGKVEKGQLRQMIGV